MLKLYTCLFGVVLLLTIVACQENHKKTSKSLLGYTVENFTNNDTIFLSRGTLNTDYYQQPKFSGAINSQKFTLENELTYPQMYRVNFHSEANKIPRRAGFYFLDPKSNAITIDSLGECSKINGPTHTEFQKQFLPFLLPQYDCEQFEFSNLYYGDSQEFDRKLLEYVRQNSDSYVGLWFAIDRLNEGGYSRVLHNTLQNFSNSIKKEKIWTFANTELNNFTIRMGNQFPSLSLKTEDLEDAIPTLGKNFTLVDFWFHSCSPCIKKFEEIRRLYSRYHSEGFEVIAISTDQTRNIERWQNTLKIKEYPWQNYLDKDAIIASREKISVFPTSFLLNENGQVIAKNPSIEELENYLKS